MDIYDQASAQEEFMRDISIAAARKVKPELQPNGFCFNCLVELLDNDVAAGCFCNSDCRDDWQGRATRKAPRP